jgi:MoaE-MoaD fusion protein
MRVRLLLFAQYRDAAGASEIDLDLPLGARAADAVTQLRARLISPSTIPERPVVALNQVFASLDDVLEQGDELALLPPVAGG